MTFRIDYCNEGFDLTAATVAAQTLKRSLTLRGIGLHSGQAAAVTLSPQPAGSGIVFVRTDLPGCPAIPVTSVDRNSAPFRTVLKNGAAEVHTVEHLLSALAGLGISDCRVEIDAPEIPGLDGSAQPFCDAILDAGIAVLNGEVDAIVVCEPIALAEGIARIQALPNPGGLKIGYTLHYPGHALAQGSFELDVNPDSFVRQIAPARTFAIKKDAEAMRAAGLGKGATTQNTLIVDGERVLENTLRFENEPVRHKILDLIGDLYVLGRPLYAHIVAHCSGHRMNAALAHELSVAMVGRASSPAEKA